jgi:hypothetical protein
MSESWGEANVNWVFSNLVMMGFRMLELSTVCEYMQDWDLICMADDSYLRL